MLSTLMKPTKLKTSMFSTLMKHNSETFFFASGCGPCMQLAPEWNKLAKLLKKLPEVKIAKVDCTVEAQLCNEQFVRSYPTIRLYPSDSYGTNKYMVFTGYNRDAYSLRSWLIQHLPEMVENFTPYLFQQEITHGATPFIVDFYTPCKFICYTTK